MKGFFVSICEKCGLTTRLSCRKNTAGRYVYTGLFYNPATGKHDTKALHDLQGRSCTSKAAADEAARRIFDKDLRAVILYLDGAKHAELSAAAAHVKLGIEEFILETVNARMASRSGELLSAYLTGFWAPGSAYLKAKEAAGAPLSAIYVNNSRSAITHHVAPWLSRKYPELTLQGTRPAHLEELKQYLVDSGLGSSRVNGIVKAVRVALGEAWRLEAIPDNPASKVHKLPDPAPKRQIFSMEEARAFFAVKQDARYQTMNLTAALAGLRLGEIRGLQVEDIRESIERSGKREVRTYFLHVCHNWQDWEAEGHKMKGPKHSTQTRIKDRDVPIPPALERALRAVAERNPHRDGFVFWGDIEGQPPSTVIISQHFGRVCHEIGIPEKERKRRGLTFHAWRHWYNTNMRPYLPDYQPRMLTGHTSEAMTDRYTEITEEQRAAVGRIAAGLLK